MPRSLEVNKAQRDLAIEPSKYPQTFMEKRRGTGENSKNMTIPFADVMWSAVLAELKDELATQTIYGGVGVAGFAAYAAGNAYSVGAKIYYTQDSEIRYFECIVATSAGQNPDTHPLKWEWAGAKALAVGFQKLLDDEETVGNFTRISTGLL